MWKIWRHGRPSDDFLVSSRDSRLDLMFKLLDLKSSQVVVFQYQINYSFITYLKNQVDFWQFRFLTSLEHPPSPNQVISSIFILSKVVYNLNQIEMNIKYITSFQVLRSKNQVTWLDVHISFFLNYIYRVSINILVPSKVYCFLKWSTKNNLP